MFLEGDNWNGWTDRQRDVVLKRQGTRVKSSCVCLDPRDWQTIIVVWSQLTGWKWCGKHGVKVNRLNLPQGIVGKQTDLEKSAKLYWQPLKRTKQWNTASKWRWLCQSYSALIEILGHLSPPAPNRKEREFCAYTLTYLELNCDVFDCKLQIHPSINQSNFYSANIPGEARLSGTTAKSVFNSSTLPQHQQAMGSDGIYGGKAKSKRCVFRYFLMVATEMAERTDSGRLFQRDGAQEWTALAPVLVLTPRDWQTIIIVWSQWMGRNRCGKHGVKINRLFFPQGFVGQQIDLKKYSKPYWQPMKRTKQWKTASKWRRLCHQAGQLILYTL